MWGECPLFSFIFLKIMDWKFWKKPDTELPLHESFPKPARIRKDGKALPGAIEAEEVKRHFLELDAFYDNLLEKVFRPEGIDAIDELERFSITPLGKGRAFAVSAGEAKISLSRHENATEDFEINSLEVSTGGETYSFSKTGEGHYNFFGKLDEAEYDGLVKPNVPEGHEKDCFLGKDGFYRAAVRPCKVAGLMRRLIFGKNEENGKEDDAARVQLYESSKRPTAMKRKGRAVCEGKEASTVKAHFLELDSAYEGLFGKVFEESGIDEIDELNYDNKSGAGMVFSVIGQDGTKINVAHEFSFRDIIVFSVNGDTYEFSKPTYPIDFPKGHYNFLGNLSETDYRQLVEPNADIGKDEVSGNRKAHCYGHEDGRSGGTIKAEVVPELMKRIISYATA